MSRSQTIVALTLTVASLTAAAQDTNPRIISVSGDAEVRVVPNEVILTLGIETSDLDLQVSKAENDRLSSAVIAAAKQNGVEDKHIQTGFLDIEPRYDSPRREFIGYFVRKTVVVTLRDLSRFEALLSDALEAGTNYVHGIEFRTTELRQHRDEARALAMTAAKEKAEALAGELGEKIGAPTNINEGYSHFFSPYGGWWGSYRGGGMSQNVIQNAVGGGAPEGPTMPGQIAVTAGVRVTFELVD